MSYEKKLTNNNVDNTITIENASHDSLLIWIKQISQNYVLCIFSTKKTIDLIFLNPLIFLLILWHWECIFLNFK